MERLTFKFLEKNLTKVTRLVHTHQVLYERIRDFDLKEFNEPESITQLETHFGFDVLSQSDALLAYLCQSEVCKKLLKDQNVSADAIEKRIIAQMSGKERLTSELSAVLTIHEVRCNEMQGNLVKGLVNYLKVGE